MGQHESRTAGRTPDPSVGISRPERQPLAPCLSRRGVLAPVVLPMAQAPHRGETDAAQEILPRESETSVRGRLPGSERFWTFLEAAGRGKDTITAYRWDAGWWERQAWRRGSTVYTLRVGDVEAIIRGVHPATARRKLG